MRVFLFPIVSLTVLSCGLKEATSQQNTSQPVVIDSSRHRYCWTDHYALEDKLINRIVVPAGYERVDVSPGSFGAWLRNLPLKKGRPDVMLHSGKKKLNQRAQYAVVDIDVGKKDLQQCADAVMRLRAEYLYTQERNDDIHFNFTSGFNCDFNTWSKGFRPFVDGNKVSWVKQTSPSSDYASFKDYLQRIFMFCGTQSLSQELKAKSLSAIEPGDVFIHGGFPGHAVMVLDVADHSSSGERLFLLAQSYMPAQDIHVLINPNNASLSPWYSNNISGDLVTPEWTFKTSELMQF